MAVDKKQGKILVQDVKQQTSQIMENIKAILQAAGYSLSEVVQSTVYLSSMMLFNDFNAEYSKYFDKEPPARVTAGVELMPNALVEISVIAYKE